MKEKEVEVEPLELSNHNKQITIDGVITKTNVRRVADNGGSMFVRIPRTLIQNIINLLETPLDHEISLSPLIEVLHVYSPNYGWLAILKRPDRGKQIE